MLSLLGMEVPYIVGSFETRDRPVHSNRLAAFVRYFVLGLGNSDMRYRVLVSFIAIAEASAMTGCKALNTPYTKQYETVSANPNHDSVTAEREHAKALKYLDCFEPDHPGKLAKAEIHLKKALVADVTYGPAHNSLGVVYMLQRNYYIAAWEFEYAAKLMPSNTEPIYNLAQLYEAADKLELAIEYYEQAIAIEPRDPAVIGSLAAAMLRSDRTLDEVRPLLQDLVFYDNREDWIAWAQDQLGRKPLQIVFR